METHTIALNEQTLNLEARTDNDNDKESCITKNSNTPLVFAALLAIAIMALGLAAPLASAQMLKYMQMPGSGNFSSGSVFNLPGYGNVQVTESTEPATFWDQTGAYNQGAGSYYWGTDTQRLNVYNTSLGNWDYTVTFNFQNGPPDLSRLILVPVGLSVGTTATVNEQGNLVGEYNFGGFTSTTLYTPSAMTFSSAGDGDYRNTGWALFQLDQSDGNISSLSLSFDQVSGDGVGFTLGYTSQAPEPSDLMLFGSGILGIAGVLRRRLVG